MRRREGEKEIPFAIGGVNGNKKVLEAHRGGRRRQRGVNKVFKPILENKVERKGVEIYKEFFVSEHVTANYFYFFL